MARAADPWPRHRRSGALAALLLAVVVAVAAAPVAASHPAAATVSALPTVDRTATDVADLAEAAASGDDDALAALLATTAIDGRVVDLDSVVDRATDADRVARLLALATALRQATPGPTGDPAAEARDVLDGDRYRPADVPRPFAGVLDWIAERLDSLGGLLGRVFESPARAVTTLGAMLLATVLLVLRGIRRRARARVEQPAGRDGRGRPVDPADLERRADDAERAGDLELAVRLRFRAGLLRLDRTHRVAVPSASPSGRLAAALHSPEFDRLARAFDEIAYGGRPARPADVEAARRDWPAVVAAVGPGHER